MYRCIPYSCGYSNDACTMVTLVLYFLEPRLIFPFSFFFFFFFLSFDSSVLCIVNSTDGFLLHNFDRLYW